MEKPSENKTQKEGLVAVRGARQHNLKNVTLEIPRDALVFTTTYEP